MNKNEIIAFLKAHKEEMRQKYGVNKIGLFGSCVRDEAQEDSDIDIAVEMDERHIFRNFFALVSVPASERGKGVSRISDRQRKDRYIYQI